MGPGAAVAEVRHAVRTCLSDLTAGDLVLVACSGGADSLALAAAAAFVAPRLGLRAGGVTVDHGLQPGSAERAGEVTALLSALGLDPAQSRAVTVPASAAGPEAAARQARYAALDEAAHEHDAVAVLLGHTLDDQAETVLLGLARGSGGRSLAGMPARRGQYRRPLLALRRTAIGASQFRHELRCFGVGQGRVMTGLTLRPLRKLFPKLLCQFGGIAKLIVVDVDILGDYRFDAPADAV